MSNRTEKVMLNASVSMFCQIITFLLNFVNRTIFIQILGVEYLGVNGLFTNVLSLLSLAELGIGGAITFHLYKPLADNNRDELKRLIKIYSLVYKFIGMAVLIIGILIMPFLKNMIGEVPNINENIYVIYMIFLLDSVVSYMNVYKSALLEADQKNYIVISIRQLTTIVFIILKLVILNITKNYLLYLGFQIISTITMNIIITINANKHYTFIKDAKKEPIDKNKLKEIYNDTKSIVLYKFGGTILDGTDNIITSYMLGVAMVGYASNYTMIITALNTIINQIINSFTSSIGNLNANADKQHSKEVFYRLLFICFWIYSYASIMLLILGNDFIKVWLGEQYVLPKLVLISLVLTFFIKGIQTAPWMYRSTLGLFKQGRYTPAIAAIINIILSILLCKICGIAGIFIATGISRMITMGIVDPILIYKYKFKGNVKEYFKKIGYYYVLALILYVFINFFSKLFNVNGFGMFLLKAIAFSIVYNIIFIAIFIRTKELKEVVNAFKNILSKILQKINIKRNV